MNCHYLLHAYDIHVALFIQKRSSTCSLQYYSSTFEIRSTK